MKRGVTNLTAWLTGMTVSAAIFPEASRVHSRLALPEWPIANTLASIVIVFLLWDLVLYLLHRLQHAVPWLWLAHRFHHSDATVDVTTGVRHNPAEAIWTAAVFWGIAVLLGPPPMVTLLYGWILFGLALLTHARRPLPCWMECLGLVLITRQAHLLHHSPGSEGTNFGGIFSVWDRLFGTWQRA